MDISLSRFLFVGTELLMEVFGLFLAYRFGVAYAKTKDNKLLVITIAFVSFLIADLAVFIGSSFFDVTFALANEWHNIIVNILLILLITVVIRGPGWQEKVRQSRARVFGTKLISETEKKDVA